MFGQPKIPNELTGNGRFVIERKHWTPSYLKLSSVELKERIEHAKTILSKCTLCPRKCNVNRYHTRGFCGVRHRAIVSSAFPHMGEEDCLRGWHGSGTIFFSGCNLKCVFCQNFEISHSIEGEELQPYELAKIMLRLQDLGCHNINFVTPTHVVPQILEAIGIAVESGLKSPLLYNCGGYESVETIKLLDGIFDIYMPDFKLWYEEHCKLYLGAEDYSQRAREAIIEMHRQVGPLKVDETGIALQGVIIRHLVMPGMIDDTRQILNWIANSLSPDTYINIMDQYHPQHFVRRDQRFYRINRPITTEEFHKAIALAKEAGLWRMDKRWL